jgi:hypothetical protein
MNPREVFTIVTRGWRFSRRSKCRKSIALLPENQGRASAKRLKVQGFCVEGSVRKLQWQVEPFRGNGRMAFRAGSRASGER